MLSIPLIFIWMLVKGVEGNGIEEGNPYGSSDGTKFVFLVLASLLFMLTLRREDDSDEEGDSRDNVSTLVIADTEEAPMATLDDASDHVRPCEIQLILERRFKTSGSCMKNAVRKLKKTAKTSHLTNILKYECWKDVVRTVVHLIPPFSSSAGRYAKFRSNRRFKPGD